MGSIFRYLLFVLAVAPLTFFGCASDSQTFMGPNGELKTCASTSQAQGITGIILAHNRFTRCVDDIKANGYREIEDIGSIGIMLYSSEASGFRVSKVYDNSPAAKAGIVRGDFITAINGQYTVHRPDVFSVFGEVGSPVEITISREGKEATYRLVRVSFKYSRVLEDITF
jgi:S1-C subfamily serine protease